MVFSSVRVTRDCGQSKERSSIESPVPAAAAVARRAIAGSPPAAGLLVGSEAAFHVILRLSADKEGLLLAVAAQPAEAVFRQCHFPAQRRAVCVASAVIRRIDAP